MDLEGSRSWIQGLRGRNRGIWGREWSRIGQYWSVQGLRSGDMRSEVVKNEVSDGQSSTLCVCTLHVQIGVSGIRRKHGQLGHRGIWCYSVYLRLWYLGCPGYGGSGQDRWITRDLRSWGCS